MPPGYIGKGGRPIVCYSCGLPGMKNIPLPVPTCFVIRTYFMNLFPRVSIPYLPMQDILQKIVQHKLLTWQCICHLWVMVSLLLLMALDTCPPFTTHRATDLRVAPLPREGDPVAPLPPDVVHLRPEGPVVHHHQDILNGHGGIT